MSFTTIEEYNNYLVEKKTDVDIIEYIKKINTIEYNIDISFIDEFIKLIDKNICCIHHSMLQKYGVLKLKKGTCHVKDLLVQNEFIENKDFEITNVRELRSQGGTHNKNEYYLHPETFKLCLIRSKNTKVYARYYLLLEKSIKYFKEYQKKVSDNKIYKLKYKIIQKDISINKLEDKMNILIETNKEILEDSKETKKQNEEILKINKRMELQLEDSNDKIYDMHDELEITNEKLDDTTKTVNLVAKKLDIAVIDRVSRPRKLSRLEYFIIMKTDTNTDYKYYIIRGQKGYANGQKNKLDEYTEIKTIECCPNANILWRLLKEQLINNFEYHGNKLNIIDMNEDTFLEKIDIIYNTRKIVEIN